MSESITQEEVKPDKTPIVTATSNFILTGVVSLLGDVTFTPNSQNEFTLTCISTGGPATTVTWTRDSAPAVGLIDTVVVDGVTGTSNNTLLVTGRLQGLYTCTVSNRISSESSASLLITCETLAHTQTHIFISFLLLSPVPTPPSGVIVSQNGPNSLLVTWTPSDGPNVTGYTIFYQQQDGGDSGSVEAEETNNRIIISGLIRGATYSISIMAKSDTLPSDTISEKIQIIGTRLTFLLCEIFIFLATQYKFMIVNHIIMD